MGLHKVEAVDQTCSVKKVVLEILQFFLNLETLAQVFFREVKEISKNTFSYKTPLVSIYQ